jgi:hypothetical protein
LKQIRVYVTNDPSSAERILDYIQVCVILHNMLVDDAIEKEWEREEDITKLDDPGSAPKEGWEELYEPIANCDPPDARRQQLTAVVNNDYLVWRDTRCFDG